MFPLKKHFLKHLLSNKTYLCRRNVRKKKEGAKHKLIVFKYIFQRSKYYLLKIVFNKNMLKIVQKLCQGYIKER